MVGNPTHRHALTKTIDTSAVCASPSQGRASRANPISARPLLTIPQTGLRNSCHRNPTITSDRVTGMKKIARYAPAPQVRPASSTANRRPSPFCTTIVSTNVQTLCQNAVSIRAL